MQLFVILKFRCLGSLEHSDRAENAMHITTLEIEY